MASFLAALVLLSALATPSWATPVRVFAVGHKQRLDDVVTYQSFRDKMAALMDAAFPGTRDARAGGRRRRREPPASRRSRRAGSCARRLPREHRSDRRPHRQPRRRRARPDERAGAIATCSAPTARSSSTTRRSIRAAPGPLPRPRAHRHALPRLLRDVPRPRRRPRRLPGGLGRHRRPRAASRRPTIPRWSRCCAIPTSRDGRTPTRPSSPLPVQHHLRLRARRRGPRSRRPAAARGVRPARPAASCADRSNKAYLARSSSRRRRGGRPRPRPRAGARPRGARHAGRSAGDRHLEGRLDGRRQRSPRDEGRQRHPAAGGVRLVGLHHHGVVARRLQGGRLRHAAEAARRSCST